jgi:threonine 3-dehydrogenase
MKALLKSKPEKGLTLTDWPDPKPGPSDVVVRVKATSLCGTDAHIYNWDEWASHRLQLPRILGHELCGEIVEAGPEVSSVQVGDLVAAESHLTCGTCFQCRTGQAHVCKSYRILGIDFDGSYAQFVALPERLLWKTAPEIPPELACVQEPLGNAVDAALAEDVTGHTLLVTGCGPTGLFAIAIARISGAAQILATDISDYRLNLAKQVGADHILNVHNLSPDTVASTLWDLTGGDGVDAALEMSGHPDALHLAFRTVKNGGRVTLFGIPKGQVCFDLTNEIIFKGIRVYGVTGRRLFATWYRLAGLFKAGLNIRPVVTHTISMADFDKGFTLVNSGECGKVVMFP